MRMLPAMLAACVIGGVCAPSPCEAVPAQPAVTAEERASLKGKIRGHLKLSADAPLGPAEFARVTELDFSSNFFITDADAAWLADPATGLKGLTSLNLFNTGVTDAGVQDLARADTGLKGLTELWLSGTQVTDAGVKAAEARWPGIKILR